MIVPNHPYAIQKRLSMQGCNGLRVNDSGELLIPMFRGERLVSLQRILPDGTKKFATGCPAKLATFTIDRPKSVITILVEGFATGATVAEAVPSSKVVVCFSASNLAAVAEHGDWKGAVVIAGDNDATTKEIHGTNPGEEAAKKAALAIGCGYAIPTSNESMDWNDLFVMRLEKLEADEAEKPWPSAPHKLRALALAPIRAEILKNLRRTEEKRF